MVRLHENTRNEQHRSVQKKKNGMKSNLFLHSQRIQTQYLYIVSGKNNTRVVQTHIQCKQ